MIRRPPRSTLSSSSAASDVYKRQIILRRDASVHPQGQRLAMLVTAHPFWELPDDDKRYQGIVAELTRFNNGKKPDVISINPQNIPANAGRKYQLHYARTAIGNTNQHALY